MVRQWNQENVGDERRPAAWLLLQPNNVVFRMLGAGSSMELGTISIMNASTKVLTKVILYSTLRLLWAQIPHVAIDNLA